MEKEPIRTYRLVCVCDDVASGIIAFIATAVISIMETDRDSLRL